MRGSDAGFRLDLPPDMKALLAMSLEGMAVTSFRHEDCPAMYGIGKVESFLTAPHIITRNHAMKNCHLLFLSLAKTSVTPSERVLSCPRAILRTEPARQSVHVA